MVRGFGFRGYIQVVTPGIGVLNNKLPSLAATNLPNGTLGAGAAWGILYAKMVGIPNVVAYDSSMADGSKNNTGCTAADTSIALDAPATTNFSAAAWIARIADEYGFGKSGENPGLPAVTDPTLAFYLDPSAAGHDRHHRSPRPSPAASRRLLGPRRPLLDRRDATEQPALLHQPVRHHAGQRTGLLIQSTAPAARGGSRTASRPGQLACSHRIGRITHELSRVPRERRITAERRWVMDFRPCHRHRNRDHTRG